MNRLCQTVRLVRAFFFFLCLMFVLFLSISLKLTLVIYLFLVSMASALVPIILSSCSPGLYQGQFTRTRMQNKNPKVDSPLTWSGLVCYQKEFDNCFGANCPNRLLHLV